MTSCGSDFEHEGIKSGKYSRVHFAHGSDFEHEGKKNEKYSLVQFEAMIGAQSGVIAYRNKFSSFPLLVLMRV